jgi:hypothetical protein
MTRLLLCLTLCVLLGLVYHNSQATRQQEEKHGEQAVRAEPLRPGHLALLTAASPGGLPAGVPWAGLVQLGRANLADSDPLPDPDPLTFMQKCLQRYDREVKGYNCILEKQERVAGSLHPREIVQAHFREKPFSVLMKWLKGAGKAQAALYVEGENNNHMLVLPAGFLRLVGVVERPLDHPDVKASGRFGIEEFGMKKGLENAVRTWSAARRRQALHVAYEGIYRVGEAGGRLCYRLHRTRFDHPEQDGILDVVLYLDIETWLQVGSVIRGQDGRLIGEYFFRDIQLNPVCAPDQFTRAALRR